MKLDKKTNVKRGIRYGLINKMVSPILTFLVQTVTIKVLGAEYVGIKGLFSSILSVLSLAELGIGTAIVYSMYKPIAEDDYYTIGALLNLYKRLYRVIGFIVMGIGLVLMPFLEHLIKGEYPQDINLRVVFALYLCNTVLSYWLYAYKSSLLNAYQRTDVITNISTLIQILTCAFQICFLLITKNFYLFLSLSIIFTIVSNLFTSACVDKMYPFIECKGNIQNGLKKDIKTNVAGLLIGNICGTTRNTFDTIFMSMFLGLTQAAIYSNYFYILVSLNGFTGILLTSMLAGVGNSIVTQSKQENFKQMMMMHTVYMMISGWMAICMLCLYQPFMKIWVGDELLFPEKTMVLFAVYFYIIKLGDIRGVYADGAGLFWQNRYRTLIEAIANIVLNYLFVIKWGAFGIMLATIITVFFIGFIGSTLVIFKYYFDSGIKEYLMNSGICVLITFFAGLISYNAFSLIRIDSLLITLVMRAICCATIVPALYLGIMALKKDYREAFRWSLSILVRR